MSAQDLTFLVVAVFAVVALVFVLRWRRTGHSEWLQNAGQEEVCEHLAPALQKLLERGHIVRAVGQKAPEMPLEIHLTPRFDPAALQADLALAEPVHLSERGVLYCRECWCELHPVD